jgi:hypothetical protein
MMEPGHVTTCVLCSSLSEGESPFGLAEGWGAARDVTGRWRAACPDHVEPVRWVSMRMVETT